jgi:hypothetical protein
MSLQCRARSALLIAIGTTALVARAEPQIAVVVHRDTPVQDLSLATLRRLYLGQTTTFGNGQRVVLLEYTPVQAPFYRKALGMSPELVHRHWIGLVFQGEDANPPQPFRDADALKRFVADHPGAIAFMDLRSVDASVKLIKVGGQAATDAHYPLR